MPLDREPTPFGFFRDENSLDQSWIPVGEILRWNGVAPPNPIL